MTRPGSFRIGPTAFHVLVIIAAGLTLRPVVGAPENPVKQRFDLPADAAETALKRFSELSGWQVIFPTDVVAGVRTNPVQGEFGVREALDQMLAGTGLVASADESIRAFAIMRRYPPPRRPPSGAPGAKAPDLPAWTPAPADVAGDDWTDQTIRMRPFEVDTSKDTGYLAKNTLSAYGMAGSVLNAPQTLQIADRELLDDLNFNTMEYAANYAAGGITHRSYNPGDDQFIWGFRAQTTLLNGVPFGQAGAGVTTMYDIDHIEFIKGPAALVFGQDAYTGGIINYVTRQPTATPQAEMDLSYGSFNERRAALHASGPLTMDLGYRLDLGGDSSRYSDQNDTFYRDRVISAEVAYRASDTSKLTVSAYNVVNDYLYTQDIMDPATGRPLAVPNNYSVLQPWATYNTPAQGAYAVLTSSLGAQIESRTFLAYRNYDATWLRPELGPTIAPATTTITGNIAQDVRESIHYTLIEQSFLKDFDTGFIHQSWQAGYEQRDDVQDAIIYGFNLPALNYRNPVYVPFPSGPPATTSNTNTHDRLTGIYLQDVLSFFKDRAEIVLGGRFNDYYHATGAPIPPTGQGSQSIQDQSKNVGRVGVVIHPVEHTTVYYQHSQAFIFNTNIDAYDSPLPPQTGNNDEVGAKAELFDGALLVTGAYFDLRLTNVATNYIEPAGYPLPGTLAAEALGQSVNHGYEVDANYSKKFEVGQFNGIATVYHGNIRDNFGNKIQVPANNTNSLFGTFRFAQGAISGFGFGAGENFQGLRDGYNYTNPALPVNKWPAYTRADALIFYRARHWSVQLNLQNITNQRYVEGGETADWIYLNPGRILKCTAAYRY